MKKLLILLSLLVFACSSDDTDRETQNNEPQEDTLIGIWELIEIYGSDGGNSEHQWSTVQEQFRYTYTFIDASRVNRSSFECEGTYESNLDFLEVNFDCSDSQFYMEFIDVAFENHNLILTPDPVNCDEGCKLKFRKLSSN